LCGYCLADAAKAAKDLEPLVERLEARVAELLAGGLKGGACFICAREAFSGLTFKFKPVCLSCAPHSLAGEVMLEFTDTEEEAITAGGEAAGAYLDQIGKTDLADLTPEQWHKFLGCFLHGYSDAMREAARTNPPF
jgi:hypothetical protein